MEWGANASVSLQKSFNKINEWKTAMSSSLPPPNPTNEKKNTNNKIWSLSVFNVFLFLLFESPICRRWCGGFDCMHTDIHSTRSIKMRNDYGNNKNKNDDFESPWDGEISLLTTSFVTSNKRHLVCCTQMMTSFYWHLRRRRWHRHHLSKYIDNLSKTAQFFRFALMFFRMLCETASLGQRWKHTFQTSLLTFWGY